MVTMKMNTKSLGILTLLAVLVIGISLTSGCIQKQKTITQTSTNFISIPIPIGSYSIANVSSSFCGVATESGIVGNVDDPRSFSNPRRYLAQLIWFGDDGYLEYRLKNPLVGNSRIKTLRLFFEACSEAPGYDLNHKTDISIYINGEKVGTQTINGDFGGKRGKYTPEWWPIDNTQYGKPIFIEIRKDGTYVGNSYNLDWTEKRKTKIHFKRVSDVGIEKLNLNQKFIKIRIGVDKDAQHKGGINLFGEKFGNYPQTLTLGLEYEGEKIYQPRMIDIIENPEKYEDKTVIMAVHPGGWGCPPGKATPIPAGFSRSAIMIYDNTGCLYGGGDILIGKILSPEVHTINTPGNETIVIKAKVKLDKNNIPFIAPER